MTVFYDLTKLADLRTEPETNKDEIEQLVEDIEQAINDNFDMLFSIDVESNHLLGKAINLGLYDIAKIIFDIARKNERDLKLHDTNELGDTALHVYLRQMSQKNKKPQPLDKENLLQEFVFHKAKLGQKNKAGQSAIKPLSNTPYKPSHENNPKVSELERILLPLLKEEIWQYILINYKPARSLLYEDTRKRLVEELNTESDPAKKKLLVAKLAEENEGFSRKKGKEKKPDHSRKEMLLSLKKEFDSAVNFNQLKKAFISAATVISYPDENARRVTGLFGRRGSGLYKTLKAAFKILDDGNFDKLSNVSARDFLVVKKYLELKV